MTLTIPSGDVKLQGGRRLRRKGPMPFPSPFMTASGEWRHPTSLTVLADASEEHGMRYRHVSLSYADRREPSDLDVAEVALAFLDGAAAVHRLDGGAHAPVVHLFDDEQAAEVAAKCLPAVRRFVRAWLPSPSRSE